LRRLEITDNTSNIARFLNGINLLPMSKVHLNACESLHEASPYLPSIFDWLSNHFKQPAGAPQNRIRSFILREVEDEFWIHGFQEVLYREQETLETDAMLMFNFPFELETFALFGEAVERTFLPLVPISSIVLLDVTTRNFSLSPLCWLTIFGSIPTLESIRLRAAGAVSFFHALLPDLRNPQLLPFKALKSIGLAYGVGPINHSAIVNVLHRRLKLGTPLQEFVFIISDSMPRYYVLSQLLEVVSRVGLYRGPGDESDKE
jgi:hypothetical protein